MSAPSIKKITWILVGGVALAGSVAVGFASWNVFEKTDESGIVEERSYSIVYHRDSTTINGPTGLDIDTYFDLLDCIVQQEDLMANRLYFNGWKVGNNSTPIGNTVFTTGINHRPSDMLADLPSRPDNNTLHLWAQWSSTVKNADVLFHVTYNTNKAYRTIVPATTRFYLFDITLPDLASNQKITGFRYNSTDYTPNDALDLTDSSTFSELGLSGSRTITLQATIA